MPGDLGDVTDQAASLPATTTPFSLVPRTLSEAIEFSRLIADSAIVPTAFRGKPGDVLVAIQMGLELGVPPLSALANIAVINGRACVWGDLMLAIVQRSGLLVTIQERDAAAALKAGAGKCRVVRRGDPTEHVAEFSLDDAKRANLAGKAGPWTTNPGRMLQMRARAFALRDKFADVLKGLASREEVEDYQVIPTETPGTDVLMPRSRSGAPAPGPAAPPPTEAESPSDSDGAGLPVVSVEEVVPKTGNGKTFYVARLRGPAGGIIEASTFSESLYATALGLVGREAVAETKTTERNGKTYLNLVSLTPVGEREPGAEG